MAWVPSYRMVKYTKHEIMPTQLSPSVWQAWNWPHVEKETRHIFFLKEMMAAVLSVVIEKEGKKTSLFHLERSKKANLVDQFSDTLLRVCSPPSARRNCGTSHRKSPPPPPCSLLLRARCIKIWCIRIRSGDIIVISFTLPIVR